MCSISFLFYNPPMRIPLGRSIYLTIFLKANLYLYLYIIFIYLFIYLYMYHVPS